MYTIRTLFTAAICFEMRGLMQLIEKWVTASPGFEETNFSKAVLQLFPHCEKLLLVAGSLGIVLSVFQLIFTVRGDSASLPPDVEAKIKDFGESSTDPQFSMKQSKCLYCGSKQNEETANCPNCGAAAFGLELANKA